MACASRHQAITWANVAFSTVGFLPSIEIGNINGDATERNLWNAYKYNYIQNPIPFYICYSIVSARV